MIRDALKAAIVAARTPAALTGLAVELRQLADELDARAAALRRQDAKPVAERAAPRKWRQLRLAESDAQLLDGVIGGLPLDTALRRIAAAAAADADGTRAALAPLIAAEAWDEEIL